MHESKEEALEVGSKHLVSISSRISLGASNMLTEIQGWLQTESEYARISKQEAFERAIRFYHAYILQALENRDSEAQSEGKQIVSIQKRQEEKLLQTESEEEKQEREKQEYLSRIGYYQASGNHSFNNFNFIDYKNKSR
jgi:DNA replication protein DnaC